MRTTPESGSTARLAPSTVQDGEAATGTGAAAARQAHAHPADKVDTDASTTETSTTDANVTDANVTDANVTDAIDTEQAKPLWEALIEARSTSPVISAAEDAVFRFYLPLARATARTCAGWALDPDLAEQAAELGLANAVLAWRRADICAFAAFARAAMIRQIFAANARGRRLLQQAPAQAAVGD